MLLRLAIRNIVTPWPPPARPPSSKLNLLKRRCTFIGRKVDYVSLSGAACKPRWGNFEFSPHLGCVLCLCCVKVDAMRMTVVGKWKILNSRWNRRDCVELRGLETLSNRAWAKHDSMIH